MTSNDTFASNYSNYNALQFFALLFSIAQSCRKIKSSAEARFRVLSSSLHYIASMFIVRSWKNLEIEQKEIGGESIFVTVFLINFTYVCTTNFVESIHVSGFRTDVISREIYLIFESIRRGCVRPPDVTR